MLIESGVGTKPIGVSFAFLRFGEESSSLRSDLSMIHWRTLRFSPNPGQRNFPSSSVRNQFTWKIFGAFGIFCPISSQYWK